MVTLLGKGTFKTVGDGHTFSLINDRKIYLSRINTVPSAPIPIKFSPSYGTDNTIYGFGSAEPEIYKSTDSGNTWKVIAISSPDKSLVDYINYIPLLIYADRLHLFKLIIALLIAVTSYLILGYIKFNKKLQLNNLLIKSGATFIIFIVSLRLLY
ncbi:hypothetical protein [Cyanothece sp. BG0011]|uniref:hypothetical protein n=1 Tax=Cyanothece sp. BG0011 TaxID=2082950 RepID=UPI000D1F3BCF|nr:hypothetical protein [Cyanothece sp. BG0011]